MLLGPAAMIVSGGAGKSSDSPGKVVASGCNWAGAAGVAGRAAVGTTVATGF